VPHLPRLLGPRPPAQPVGALLLAALALAATADAGAFSASAHGNRAVLPQACRGCHVGHGPPRAVMLPGSGDTTCLTCHGDAGSRNAAKAKGLLAKAEGLADIAAEQRKTSRHTPPSPGQAAAAGGAASSAVSCTSCHDAHYVVSAPDPAKADVTRVKQIQNARRGATPEYELCYRCHGAAAAGGAAARDIRRLVRQANPSFHPVEAPARNTEVPSLLQPYNEQSYTACTDCHGSDQANGPRGPHGSSFKPILKARFEPDSGRAETADLYALCYRCHSRNIVVSENPGTFRFHRKHIVDEKASCRACHNSHGSTQYTHLIDFDTKIVFPNSKGRLKFEDQGVRRGACSLRCHDKDHDELNY